MATFCAARLRAKPPPPHPLCRQAKGFHRRLMKAWKNGTLSLPATSTPAADAPAASDSSTPKVAAQDAAPPQSTGAGGTGAVGEEGVGVEGSSMPEEAAVAAAGSAMANECDASVDSDYVDVGMTPEASDDALDAAMDAGIGLRRRERRGGDDGSGGVAEDGGGVDPAAVAAVAAAAGGGSESVAAAGVVGGDNGNGSAAGLAAADVPHPGPLPENIYNNGMWRVREGKRDGRYFVFRARRSPRSFDEDIIFLHVGGIVGYFTLMGTINGTFLYDKSLVWHYL